MLFFFEPVEQPQSASQPGCLEKALRFRNIDLPKYPAAARISKIAIIS